MLIIARVHLAYDIADHTPVSYGPGVFLMGESNNGQGFCHNKCAIKKAARKRNGYIQRQPCEKIIELENYYNLINGYKPLFLKQSGSDETYKEGTRFEEVYALYIFDRELRNLFMRYILEIENNIKSVLAHDFPRNMAPMVICGCQALTPVSSRGNGKRLLRRLVMSRI